MKMMRSHEAETKEEGYHSLLPHASEHIPELLVAFQAEQNHGLRCWLFELLGAARSPDLLPLFANALKGEDWALSSQAFRSLRMLDTKEARRLMFEARSFTFSTEEQTQLFHAEINAEIQRVGGRTPP